MTQPKYYLNQVQIHHFLTVSFNLAASSEELSLTQVHTYINKSLSNVWDLREAKSSGLQLTLENLVLDAFEKALWQDWSEVIDPR